ncbi:hypothetical protein K469DRAFT_214443 [Zopfia rhizophila CBS 207.26]|uniref:Uncharacterized protein n=1 Tax=Zopfia rhizophila CBS 207.26 TaxID=1314779 RepID=A0A6A6DY75_9PEZI|nr:hypothetical protein K469DRAFT_214443 [Zopfia rhizophila CBS 207.26]
MRTHFVPAGICPATGTFDATSPPPSLVGACWSLSRNMRRAHALGLPKQKSSVVLGSRIVWCI